MTNSEDKNKHELEEQLEELLSKDLDQLPSIYNLKQMVLAAGAGLDAPEWITDAKDDKPAGPMVQYVNCIEEDLKQFRHRTHQEAERCARQQIAKIMGTLTERMGATSSWLFLADDASRKGESWIRPGPTTELVMRFGSNTGVRMGKFKLRPWGKHLPGTPPGIVAHVAVTRKPYLRNDVENDPYYIKVVEETKSELAVPVLCIDENGIEQLLAVFNVESNHSNTFVEPQAGELLAAATELAPHIIILHHLQLHPQGFGWHPDAHGWTLERLLAGVCNAVSFTDEHHKVGEPEVLLGDEAYPLPRPSCTVWYLDPDAPEDEKLHVRETARFDHEYITFRRLPKNSFTGMLADPKWSRYHVGHGQPDSLKPYFQRTIKAAFMGTAYAIASPIYPPAQEAATPPMPLGTINLYFFEEELRNREIDRSKLPDKYPGLLHLATHVAGEVGTMIAEIQHLRMEVAGAHVRYRLQEQALSGVNEFEIARDTILECLGAAGCSIFARSESSLADNSGTFADPSLKRRRKLMCVATTGLVANDGTPVSRDEAIYDLDEPADSGVTVYLGSSPGSCIRRTSVEISTDDGPRPVNKFHETAALMEPHQPFLGLSVDDRTNPNRPPLGVIRISRTYPGKPFVKSDERLLRRLAQALVDAFHGWQQKPKESEEGQRFRRLTRYKFIEPVLGLHARRMKLDAVDRLGTGFAPAAVWNRHQVNATLLDLVNIFRKPQESIGRQGAFMASLRVLQPSNEDQPSGLSIYSIHSFFSTDLPDEEYMTRHQRANVGDPSVGLQTIWRRQPATFNRACRSYKPILPESEHVRSGICVPVRSVSSNGIFWSVLSLDFDNLSLEDWQPEYVQAVMLAAKQLDFLGRDNRLRDDQSYKFDGWLPACEHFLREPLIGLGTYDKPVAVQSAGIFRNLEPKTTLSEDKRASSITPLSKAVWQDLVDRTADLREAQMPGDPDMRWSTKTGGFEIPLWFGPIRSELTLRGCLGAESEPFWSDAETMRAVLGDITHLWNRFVSGRVGTGVQPFFHVTFARGKEPSVGLNFWKPKLSLGFEIA